MWSHRVTLVQAVCSLSTASTEGSNEALQEMRLLLEMSSDECEIFPVFVTV